MQRYIASGCSAAHTGAAIIGDSKLITSASTSAITIAVAHISALRCAFHHALAIQMMHAGYPGQHGDTRASVDCKYHMEGRCSLGHKCPFRHQPVSSFSVSCLIRLIHAAGIPIWLWFQNRRSCHVWLNIQGYSLQYVCICGICVPCSSGG